MTRKKTPSFLLPFLLMLSIGVPLFANEVAAPTGFESVVSISIILLVAYTAFYYLCLNQLSTSPSPTSSFSNKTQFIVLLVASFIFRIFLATKYMGHSTDMSCWAGWASGMATYGPGNFYESMSFADYPPGYMLILWPIGAFLRGSSLAYGTTAYTIVLKLPIIVFDLLAAVLIYWYGGKKELKAPLLLTAFFLFNPAVVLSSSVWGQVDIILSFFVIVMLIAFYEEKLLYASLAFVLGLLIKPQMFLFGPVFLIGYFYYCKGREVKEILKQTFISAAVSIALFLIICLPFLVTKTDPLWLFKLYFSTMGSYAYGSVNAINLIALLNGLWAPDTQTYLGLSYKLIGVLGILVTVLYTFYLAIKDKNKANLSLYGALMITGIFTLGHHMHERYIFPALICLLLAYLYVPNRKTLHFFVYFSILQSLNMSLVLRDTFLYSSDTLVFILSLLQVIGFAVFCIYAYQMSKGTAKEKTVVSTTKVTATLQEVLPKKVSKDAAFNNFLGTIHQTSSIAHRLTKKDWLILLAGTIIYAIIAFTNLGETKAPVTLWTAQQVGETATIDLGEVKDVNSLRFFFGVCESTPSFKLEASNDGQNWSKINEVVFNGENGNYNTVNNIYKWETYTGFNTSTRYIRLTTTAPTFRLIEMGVMGSNNELLPIQNVEASANALQAFDEQLLIPSDPTFYNEFYFDEIYHARTAWEHLNGVTMYETTHPPLGKVLIMFGVQLFGMTPFGWRFAGTLAGVLMLPLIYAFAKALFKRTKYAAIAMILMMFDFMHFSQTRIATIDSFVVLFIIGMFYFMYLFYKTNYLVDSKKAFIKSMVYLGLSGIFFGLGAASKWVGIYAGAGLAVIFFYTLFLRYKEYELLMHNKSLQKEVPNSHTLLKAFPKRTLTLILFCCIFFVAVPIVIYIMSYLPMITKLDYSLSYVWTLQTHMFNYHSQLTATHPFESPWYKWPFIVRPLWFYYKQIADGQVLTMSTLGNPAVWWAGAIAIVCLMVRALKSKPNSTSKFIVIGFLAQLLPWVLVTRCTFIYHYFASVPFIILATVWWIKYLEEHTKNKKRFNILIYSYLAVTVLLFVLYYPVIAGMPVSSAYARALQLFPTWYFSS